MSSLKDVSLKDVGLKDVSLKDVVVPVKTSSFFILFYHLPILSKRISRLRDSWDKKVLRKDFLKWAIPGHFLFIFVSSAINSKYIHSKTLPKIGFKLRTSGIGSNRSANRATTTALNKLLHVVLWLDSSYGQDISRMIISRQKSGRVEIEIGEASPTF